MAECHDCRCHFNPPCSACERCVHIDQTVCPEDCQTCEYDHERTGPYRLTDGTWSDGVDRTRRLSSSEFGEENPQRLGIFRPSFIDGEWIARGDVWVIVRGLKSVEWFPTHAEAIAYADRMARGAA